MFTLYTRVYKLTLLPEPAFLVRIEECVHQVIPIILWDLEWLFLYAFIQTLKLYQTLSLYHLQTTFENIVSKGEIAHDDRNVFNFI